ncbi:hypothetical protein EVAR_71698_1 [Eumeta japonica]|uniref:Uncharacterized protein n=1 Tax=Eumeta variegata TaxID=151549 RepID=A0A4C1TM66_EUMVA|nr:hypothetical protein EVAR_71698_1 [Eumeta japonica]
MVEQVVVVLFALGRLRATAIPIGSIGLEKGKKKCDFGRINNILLLPSLDEVISSSKQSTWAPEIISPISVLE